MSNRAEPAGVSEPAGSGPIIRTVHGSMTNQSVDCGDGGVSRTNGIAGEADQSEARAAGWTNQNHVPCTNQNHER